MNGGFGALCDEFYVTSRLFLKLEMALERDTVLHFFDRIRRQYPGLRRLRRRDGDCLVLEEEPGERGSRRWLRLDRTSLRLGHFVPASPDDVREFGEFILDQAPHHLSFSEIDYDHIETVYGFDLEYSGNHDQLVAETLLGDQFAGGFLFGENVAHIIDAQPYFGVALSPECDLQAYVEIKSRTSTYEVRNDNFESEPISVYLTVRKYWGVNGPASLSEGLGKLFGIADEFANEMVVPNFVNPLAAAIASRP